MTDLIARARNQLQLMGRATAIPVLVSQSFGNDELVSPVHRVQELRGRVIEINEGECND